MKRHLVPTLSVWAAVVATLLVGAAARAASCLSIQFVACCVNPAPGSQCCPCGMPSSMYCISMMLTPSQVTGVSPCTTGNWNPVMGSAGVVDLVEDVNGIAVSTNATVLWESTSTWQSTGFGEENNNFTVPEDRLLMTGYLDQNTQTPSPTFVQITNIPMDLVNGYSVVIYTLGGQPNRGGEYAVNGGDPKFVVASGDGSDNGSNGFVEAMGTDPAYGTNDWGNYVMFTGLSGNSVTITATNLFGTVPRAPINGIQIVGAQ